MPWALWTHSTGETSLPPRVPHQDHEGPEVCLLLLQQVAGNINQPQDQGLFTQFHHILQVHTFLFVRT